MPIVSYNHGAAPFVGTGTRTSSALGTVSKSYKGVSAKPKQSDKSLQSVISNIESRIKGEYREQFFREAGTILRKSMAEQFKSGGDVNGIKWKPLTPATIEAKEYRANQTYAKLTRRGKSQYRLKQRGSISAFSILIETGSLRDSYVRQTNRLHIERWDRKTGKYEFGSAHPLARVHQEGSQHVTGKHHLPITIPPRPVTIRDKDIEQLRIAAVRALQASLKGI